MLVRLAGKLVSAQVVALFMVRRGGLMRVGGEQVKFSGAGVGGLRHGFLLKLLFGVKLLASPR